jgi:hypothetical protein
MEESKFRNPTAAPKLVGPLSRYQKRELRPARIPLPASTAMPANRRKFRERAAAASALAPKNGLRPILSAVFLLALALVYQWLRPLTRVAATTSVPAAFSKHRPPVTPKPVLRLLTRRLALILLAAPVRGESGTWACVF